MAEDDPSAAVVNAIEAAIRGRDWQAINAAQSKAAADGCAVGALTAEALRRVPERDLSWFEKQVNTRVR